MNKIRILLADDHAVLRAGLKMLLDSEPDMEVVGEAGNGVDAVRLGEELRPDVVLLDISMPGLNGPAVLKLLKARDPDIKVLVVSMHDDESYLHEMLAAGASGYVPKKAADVELLAAIRSTYRGEHFIHSSMTSGLIPELNPAHKASGEKELSRREKDVLYLMALGYTNQQAAEKLMLSTKTIETYKQRINDKLGTHSRAELVRYAMEKGLLS